MTEAQRFAQTTGRVPRNDRASSFRHKVVLRLAINNGHYLAELECRGTSRRLEGIVGERGLDTAYAALTTALNALKGPCAVECYLSGAYADAMKDLDKGLHFAHEVRPYFLEYSDDPGLRDLHALLIK